MFERLVLAALIVGMLACDSSSEENECVVHDDCWNSPVSQDLGRCGGTVACVQGVCDAWCPEECEVTDPDVNPCTKPGWICGLADVGVPRCSPIEIECETSADCPEYRPSPDGAWTCDAEGICRFPGFSYLYSNP